jgi:uncharacterized protein
MSHQPPIIIPWLSWSTEAFRRAHNRVRPVLLSIVTRWSAACAEMEANVFVQPFIAMLVKELSVPVRVDADERPDIAERYGLGGWPTTVWLTPDGEMLSGGTNLGAARVIRALWEVKKGFTHNRKALVQQAAAARAARQQAARAPGADASEDSIGNIRDRILNAFDAEFGGFGRDAKFPLAAPIRFALHAGVSSSNHDLITIATSTLDRIASSAMSDPHSGAFARACATREWADPDGARLLDVHADMIVTYLDAARLLQHDGYRTRALAALAYVEGSLRNGRAFRHYDGAAAAAAAAALDTDTNLDTDYKKVNAPPLFVSESNARMLRALVHAAHTLDDERYILTAVDIAEHLLPIVYVRASGIAHYLREDRPHVFGLLADNIQMAAALLDLGEAAGQHVYIELAEEVTRSALRRFWDSAGGGFVDRIRTTAGAGDVGLLGDPLKPFTTNVEAARLLLRLAARTHDATLETHAREALRHVAVTSPAQGILSSEYGLLLLNA